jgi:hypothetical protein
MSRSMFHLLSGIPLDDALSKNDLKTQEKSEYLDVGERHYREKKEILCIHS